MIRIDDLGTARCETRGLWVDDAGDVGDLVQVRAHALAGVCLVRLRVHGALVLIDAAAVLEFANDLIALAEHSLAGDQNGAGSSDDPSAELSRG